MAESDTPTSDLCDVTFPHPEAVALAQSAHLALTGAQALATFFSVLADATRVRIVAILAAHELCVCDLANVPGVHRTTVSHQLRLLRTLRIVRFRKEGRTAFYTLDDDHSGVMLAQGLHTRMSTLARRRRNDAQQP